MDGNWVTGILQGQNSHKYDNQRDYDRQNRSANEFLKHNNIINDE
jgi:hypothetical protein